MEGRLKIEEAWSSLLSAVGALLALPAIGFLLVPSISSGKPWHTAGFLIYGAGLLFMFAASAVYHGYEGSERVRFFLHRLDYCAVAVLHYTACLRYVLPY